MGRFEQARANIRRAYEAGRESMRAARAEARAAATEEPQVVPAEPVRGGEPSPVHHSTTSADDSTLPRSLRIVAAWSWRMLVIGAVAVAIVTIVGRLKLVIVPLVIALLLAALLSPAVGWLRRAKVPRSLATALVLVGGLAAVVGVLTLVIRQFVEGAPQLGQNASDGIRQIRDWLETGPLHLSDQQLNDGFQSIQNWINDNRSTFTSGAVDTATATLDVLAGLFLVLFSLFFFLRDGQRIWRYVVRIFPGGVREQVAEAGERSWLTLVAYVRATVLVAFIDALGIGLAVVILRVPFALPLAALVFLASFIPIIGATLSGTIAVLVALVSRGPVIALILLAAVIAVQQFEGHVLQPLIMGRAVAIHPLAVIVAIAVGVVLAGIIGALVAVPIVAVLNTGIRHLVDHRGEPPPDAVVVRSNPKGE
ncbi:MAG TPA: AI-2E family transporter [Micromonosporaceae bacterium]|nr:AI-2E family transporter [Micromonosporaceae bacterium]